MYIYVYIHISLSLYIYIYTHMSAVGSQSLRCDSLGLPFPANNRQPLVTINTEITTTQSLLLPPPPLLLPLLLPRIVGIAEKSRGNGTNPAGINTQAIQNK